MKTTIILLYSLIFFSTHLFSQSPEIEWQNTVGGFGADNLYAVIQSPGGGYLLAGYAIKYSGFDYLVIKLDSEGEVEWEKVIEGSEDDKLYSAISTTDGGYLLGGFSDSGLSDDKTEACLGGVDYWVVKLNGEGEMEWQNTIGGSGNDELHAVVETTDGYLLGGYSLSGISGDKTETNIGGYDYWILKINNEGDIEWQNTIGGTGDDYLWSVTKAGDTGFLLGGYSISGVSGDKSEVSPGGTDFWVVRISSEGAIEWQNTIGGSADDKLYSATHTSDGGYMVGGYTFSDISADKTENSMYGDYWVVKLNNEGNIQWQNTIGGDGYDYLRSVIQTIDGGYFIGGFSGSWISGDKTEPEIGLGYDYWVLKLDTVGNIIWQNTIGGSDHDFLYTAIQTSNGGYLLGGTSESGISGDKTHDYLGLPTGDYWVVKLASDTLRYFIDIDLDGFGNVSVDTFATTLPVGYVGDSTDCNDLDAFIHPGSLELFNEIDDNCNGFVDEGCVVPGNLTVTPQGTEAVITWLPVFDAYKYKVIYRAAGTTEWKYKYSAEGKNHLVLKNLNCNTDYAWQIATICTEDESLTSGYSSSDTFNTFNKVPAIEWQNTIGGDDNEGVNFVQQTTEGGFIIGGGSESDISGDKTEDRYGPHASEDFWILKLDTEGNIVWQNTIGGGGYDYFTSMQQTTDGGYIAGGFSNSNISVDKTEASLVYDYWIVKLDTDGSIEWQNTIGGAALDYLYSLQQTTDGGYILAGYSDSGISGDKTEANIGFADYWIIKLDDEGNIEWQNTIGGTGSDVLRSIRQTADGGYILGGSSSSGLSGDKTEPNLGARDYWIIKITAEGDIEWQNTIGGSGDDALCSIRQSEGGGYFIAGISTSGISGDKTDTIIGGWDYWFVKLDETGNILWQNTIGSISSESCFGNNCMQQTEDGGYIFGGWVDGGISGDKTEVTCGTHDYWVIKLFPDGNIQWQNLIGGEGGDFLYAVAQTADQGYVIGGSSSSGISCDKSELSMGESDYWILKLEPEKNTGCSMPADYESTPLAAQCGLSWSSVCDAVKYRVRYKPVGTAEWEYKYASDAKNHVVLKDLTCNTEYEWQVNTICATDGSISSGYSASSFFTTAACRLGDVIENSLFKIYPNPAQNNFTVQLLLSNSENQSAQIKILNVVGEEIYFQKAEIINGEVIEAINLPNKISAGIYLVKIIAANKAYTSSLIIEH